MGVPTSEVGGGIGGGKKKLKFVEHFPFSKIFTNNKAKFTDCYLYAINHPSILLHFVLEDSQQFFSLLPF